MQISMRANPTPIFTAAQALPRPQSSPQEDYWDNHPLTPLEKRDRFIDEAATVIGTAFWGGLGGLAGGTAGLLAAGPIGGIVGAVAGATGLGALYLKGHGDHMGQLLMGGAAIATGALLGAAAGGPLGAAIGGGLGTAYAATGLYFAWDS